MTTTTTMATTTGAVMTPKEETSSFTRNLNLDYDGEVEGSNWWNERWIFGGKITVQWRFYVRVLMEPRISGF